MITKRVIEIDTMDIDFQSRTMDFTVFSNPDKTSGLGTGNKYVPKYIPQNGNKMNIEFYTLDSGARQVFFMGYMLDVDNGFMTISTSREDNTLVLCNFYELCEATIPGWNLQQFKYNLEQYKLDTTKIRLKDVNQIFKMQRVQGTSGSATKRILEKDSMTDMKDIDIMDFFDIFYAMRNMSKVYYSFLRKVVSKEFIEHSKEHAMNSMHQYVNVKNIGYVYDVHYNLDVLVHAKMYDAWTLRKMMEPNYVNTILYNEAPEVVIRFGNYKDLCGISKNDFDKVYNMMASNVDDLKKYVKKTDIADYLKALL